MTRLLVTLFAFGFLVGCGDVDSKPDTVPNNSSSADAGNSGDPDAGMNPDMGDEGPFGQVCDVPDGELAAQECSMVDQDCEEGACEKRVILDGGMPSAFAVVCGGEPTGGMLAEGDECDVMADECPDEMVCKRFPVDDTSRCYRWCRLADAYGCSAEQACVASSDLEPVFGVCADACSAQ